MSNYGHYNHQFDGNKIDFHPNSFKIVGISHHKENANSIKHETILEMEFEPDNPHDPTAIKIRSATDARRSGCATRRAPRVQ